MAKNEINEVKGHQLLSMVGKKVLRPGGVELTHQLISDLQILPTDEVVELAPGMGKTAAQLLSKNPKSYKGIDIDQQAIHKLSKKFGSNTIQFLEGTASDLPIENESADKVIGEAMLTMYIDHRKREIMKEAHRVLRKGGLYGIHELAIVSTKVTEDLKSEMTKDLAHISRVNARPLTVDEWRDLLNLEGFKIQKIELNEMQLLEKNRLIADEGLAGMAKIGWNLMTRPEARKRVLKMREVFRKYEPIMKGIAIVAEKV